MSHEATNWAFKQRGLKPSAKLVLMYLADRHNPDWGCFPSQRTLASDCEMSERSVRDQVNVLEKAGLVRKKKARRVDGQYQSDRYLLAFEADFETANSSDTANSADGKFTSKPAANTRKNQRQILPPNHVRGTCNRTGKATQQKSDQVFTDDWRPCSDDLEWAVAEGFDGQTIDHEVKLCRLQYLGKKGLNPSVKFRQWMLRAKEYRRKEAAKLKTNSLSDDPVMRRALRRLGEEL